MSGYSVNRIPSSDSVFLASIPATWSFSGLGTFSVNPYDGKYDSVGSLSAVVEENDYISFNEDTGGLNYISSTTSVISSDIDDTVSCFLWVKSTASMIVDFSVSLLYPDFVTAVEQASSSNQSFAISSGEWTLLRLETPALIPDDAYDYGIGMRVTVSSIDDAASATLSVSYPVAYCTLDFIDNPAIIAIMSKIPEFIRDEDANATPYPYQLIRFIEMATIHTGELQQLLDDFIYSDISEGKDVADATTLSTLVEPTVVSRPYMEWLAQFNGTTLLNPTTGVTPWANLPTTWQGIDLIDSVDDAEDAAPWAQIQDYNTEPAGLEDFLRWQILTGFYGVNAGTQESIVEAVKRVLTDTQSVVCTYPVDWTMNVETLISETPNTSTLAIGDEVPEILALIEKARPLGLKVQHTLA